MKRYLLILLIAQALDARGELRMSSCESSGGRIGGANVTADVAVTCLPGLTQCDEAIARVGFVGQLYDICSIEVTAPSTQLNENASIQLSAIEVYDDATRGSPEGSVQWSVGEGPLASITPDGLATAEAVYQHTPAFGQAAHMSMTGCIELLVMDFDCDNYGLYAGDLLPDSWQVAWFGEDNLDGAADSDPDGDDMINRTEYVADTDPTDGGSLLIVTNLARQANEVRVEWMGGVAATQYIEHAASPDSEDWICISTNHPPTAPSGNSMSVAVPDPNRCYRVRAAR